MWFSGQIALGLRGCCCRDLCCVVYGDDVCRLRLSCSCWICCGTGYSGGILTEDVNVKASIFANKGNNTGNKTPRLFHDLPQFFLSFFSDNLLFIPFERTHSSCTFPESILLQNIESLPHVFPPISSRPVYIHPRFNYFFWIQRRLVSYNIALRCVLLPHRFMSELKDGCPIFCMDSGAGGIVCALKALVRCALRTYGQHSQAILPDTGHFCHILPLACVSLWFVMPVLLV